MESRSSTMREYIRECRYVEVDLSSITCDYLGLSPSTVLAAHSGCREGDRDLQGVEKDMLRLTARVVLTTYGVAGRSGIGDPTRLLTVNSVANGPGAENQQDFDEMLKTRLSLRTPTALAMSYNAHLHGAAFGLDTRDILPPFVTSGSGEDILFGVTLGLCGSDYVSCSIPLAMEHDPKATRIGHNADLHLRSGHCSL
jgi:hypothetical protein